MAERYWVDGSGSWTDFLHWADASGGIGQFPAPSVGDNVYFDGNSGNPTVTVQASATLANFQLLGPCTLTLGQNLSLSVTLLINEGSFSTSTFNLSAASFASSGALSRTLSLGSGIHTFSVAATTFITSGTNFTFNAGSSTVQLSSINATISTQGLTFNNVSFTSTAQTTPSITGEHTFNNLTIAGRSALGVSQFSITGNQTVGGTLTLSAGSLSPARTFIKSSVIGQKVTLTVNSFAATNDIDFRDIAILGAAAPINASSLRFSDCKGNSGITFPAPKTVFYRATGSASWGAASAGSWSDTVGGTASATQFPLAQDTAIFPATTYPASSATTTIGSSYNIGTVDMSQRTGNTMTLSFGSVTPVLYGSLITGTGITYSGAGTVPIVFAGRNTQNITSASKTFTRSISIESPGGSVVLLDAFDSSSTSDSSVVSGIWNLNGYTTTIRSHLIVSGINARGIAFGGANLLVGILKGSGTVWDATASTNLTLSGGGTITLQTNSSGGAAKTFAGGGYQNYPTLNLGANVTIYSTGLTVTGSNKFQDITNSTMQGGILRFTGGQSNEFGAFSVTGDIGNRLTLSSSNTTPTILKKPTTWFMGANSTNGVGNTGLTFTAGDGIDYFTVSYINGLVLVDVPVVTVVSAGNFFFFF